MAIDTRSPEFVAAYQMVAQAFLEFLQGGGTFPGVEIKNTLSENPVPPTWPGAAATELKSQPNSNSGIGAKVQEDVRYAACPKREADGSYSLKNLKEEKQAESTFKVTRYTDGSCEFELCDLQGESRQIFKDNQADRMPSAVGIVVEGQITADNKIVNVKPGKGIVNGRSVKILEPLEVAFK